MTLLPTGLLYLSFHLTQCLLKLSLWQTPGTKGHFNSSGPQKACSLPREVATCTTSCNLVLSMSSDDQNKVFFEYCACARHVEVQVLSNGGADGGGNPGGQIQGDLLKAGNGHFKIHFCFPPRGRIMVKTG